MAISPSRTSWTLAGAIPRTARFVGHLGAAEVLMATTLTSVSRHQNGREHEAEKISRPLQLGFATPPKIATGLRRAALSVPFCARDLQYAKPLATGFAPTMQNFVERVTRLLIRFRAGQAERNAMIKYRLLWLITSVSAQTAEPNLQGQMSEMPAPRRGQAVPSNRRVPPVKVPRSRSTKHRSK